MLANGYVGDDHYLLERNPFLGSFRHLGLFFTSDYWGLMTHDSAGAGYWRPIYFASYFLDRLMPFPSALQHHVWDPLVCSRMFYRVFPDPRLGR